MESTSDGFSFKNCDESTSKNLNSSQSRIEEKEIFSSNFDYFQSFKLLYDNLCVKSFELPTGPDENLKCTDMMAESKKVRHDCVTCGAFTAFSDGYDSGGYFRLEEKLKENFLKNDSRKIVASDFSTMVDFLHDFTRFKRRLDDFWSIFKSKSWIEMNSTQIESFGNDVEKFAADCKQHLMEKYDCKVECFDPQFSDLDAELACFTTKTKNFSLYIIDFKFKVQCDVIERVEMTSSTTTKDDVVKLKISTCSCCSSSAESSLHQSENESKSTLHQSENASKSTLHQSENESQYTLHQRENCSKSTLHQCENEYKSSLHQSTWNILHRLDEILKLIADNYLIKFLKSLQKEEALINLYYDLINRLNCIISQGLTAVICCLLHEVYNGSATTNSTLQKWKICGPLITVHSFLSCYHEEKGMIEDLSEALTSIGRNCRFRFLKSFSQLDDICQPLIDGKGPSNGLQITLPLNRKLFRTLTDDRDPTFSDPGIWFKIHPVLFTVGLNYEETLAKTMGGLNLERQLNQRALEHYESYVRKFCAHFSDENLEKNLQILLDNIRSNLAQNCSKNVEIFQFSRRLNFLLAGQMILCCKSGKDRTAMAVSCDQTEILFERGLAPSSFSRQKILDAVRTSGSRLENTLKNVGAKRYAFTHLQLSFMPQNYRPPKGTYGKGQT